VTSDGKRRGFGIAIRKTDGRVLQELVRIKEGIFLIHDKNL